MIRDLQKDSLPEEVSAILQEDGIVRIPSFLSDVSKVEAEALSAVGKYGSKYPFGKGLQTGSWVANYPEINKLFDDRWMRKIAKLYLGKVSRYREGVFITHDFRDDQGLGRNGHLHFDRTRAFKFFFYLMDCEILDHGPFMCFPGTQDKGKELRRQTPKGTKYARIPNRLEIDFPELGYKAEDATPVFGKAGTLLIFDSDMFHLGGRVKSGHERLILRSHSRT